MAGVLYGVGIGPGDYELVTLKAVRILKECDVIGIPAEHKSSCTAYKIAVKAVPEIENKPVISVCVPMTRDKNKLETAYNEGCEKIEEELKKGKSIAFLNLGDPTVYGTYMKIHNIIIQKNYKAEIVSGVPSFCAVAARLGIALGQGNENIHIIPGCYNYDSIEMYKGTKILMKSAGETDNVKKRLAEMEKAERVSVKAVSDCGMDTERVYGSADMLDNETGYFTTIIVKDYDIK